MFTKVLNKKIIYAAFCLCLTSISSTRSIARIDYSTGQARERTVERMLYRQLGLSEDVNDSVIIQLLDKPDKRRNGVILLIRYRRISSATQKLLQIFNDDKANVFEKIAIAEALCDFGNKEWIPTIKALSTDPNGFISRIPPKIGVAPLKIDVAGLLARAGDYSQFKIVASSVDHNEASIRHLAINALGNFGHKTDPVTDSAVQLLYSVATSDDVPSLRDQAIVSLEKIAKTKPEVTSKIIDALRYNVNSADKSLRTMCKQKLKVYSKSAKTN